MSRFTVALVAAVSMLFALAAPALAQDDAPAPIPSGPTTVDRAVAWSQATFADGSAPDVILARDDTFPDSLGAGMAQAVLEAPLLLTNTTVLSPQTAAEMARLGAQRVLVLGGEEAVAPTVVTALEALGLQTERIAGATRAETAVAIIQRFQPDATTVVLARANAPADNPTAAFADSIVTAALSAVGNVPVLLTNNDELLPETEAALAALPIEDVIVAGGESAIGSDVLDQVAATIDDGNDATEETVTRLDGPTRDTTAIRMQEFLGYSSAADAGRVILVEGFSDDAWASGFAAAAQAGNDAALVLANGEEISQATADFLSGAGVPLICGPGTSPAACDAAFAALNG